MITEKYILSDDEIGDGRFENYTAMEVFWNASGGITIKEADRSETEAHIDIISLTPTQAEDLIEVLQNMLNSDD